MEPGRFCAFPLRPTNHATMKDSYRFIGLIYNDDAGQQVGPITTATLKVLVASGTLKPSDMVTKAYWDGGVKHVYLCRVKDVLRQADPG
jgi:hypothetical protein